MDTLLFQFSTPPNFTHKKSTPSGVLTNPLHILNYCVASCIMLSADKGNWRAVSHFRRKSFDFGKEVELMVKLLRVIVSIVIFFAIVSINAK